VLVVNTEGATDPALYEKIVGRSPESVLRGDRTADLAAAPAAAGG
jgi:diaminopropionate ammonia-lyase